MDLSGINEERKKKKKKKKTKSPCANEQGIGLIEVDCRTKKKSDIHVIP